MAHYAEIINGKVERVLVTDNNWTKEETLLWLYENVSKNLWIQTSYNANIRAKFAAIGDEYRKDLDIFVEPKLSELWGDLDINTGLYSKPKPKIKITADVKDE